MSNAFKKMNDIIQKDIHNLKNTQGLISALEEIIYKYIDQILNNEKINSRDMDVLTKLYTALAQREKNIFTNIHDYINNIIEMKHSDLSDIQIQELQNFLATFEIVDIYKKEGELTDPKQFTKERSQILEELDEEGFTD